MQTLSEVDWTRGGVTIAAPVELRRISPTAPARVRCR